MKSFDNPHYSQENGCLMYIDKLLGEYKDIFTSSSTFRMKLADYEAKYKKSAITEIENVIKELGSHYFQALSPHPISFKLAASNLGSILLRLK